MDVGDRAAARAPRPARGPRAGPGTSSSAASGPPSRAVARSAPAPATPRPRRRTPDRMENQCSWVGFTSFRFRQLFSRVPHAFPSRYPLDMGTHPSAKNGRSPRPVLLVSYASVYRPRISSDGFCLDGFGARVICPDNMFPPSQDEDEMDEYTVHITINVVRKSDGMVSPFMTLPRPAYYGRRPSRCTVPWRRASWRRRGAVSSAASWSRPSLATRRPRPRRRRPSLRRGS